MSADAARAVLGSTTANLPDHIKLALTYAEESSKRARWIIFLIQIAALLVLASVWGEANFNWLNLRLEAAQNAVRYMECEPQARYPIPDRVSANTSAASKGTPTIGKNASPAGKDTSAGGKDAPPAFKSFSTEIAAQASNGRFMPLSREELDIAYSCAANPLSDPEKEKARGYIKDWHYSLTQARKNVADLQQLMGNRVLGVGVPVLGIVFDVNDLSVVAGITFSILLSWFYYNVRRQDKNTNHVFKMAEDSKIKVDGRTMLDTTYHLLRMTQVLTIPPGRERDTRDVTILRRLTRLPNLILWSAALAQGVVLANDVSTINDVNYLHPYVGRFETAFALYLFAFILYRTIICIYQQRYATELWVTAWNKICTENNDRELQVRVKWLPPEKQGLSVDQPQDEAATPVQNGRRSSPAKDAVKASFWKWVPLPVEEKKKWLPALVGVLVAEIAIAAHMADEWLPRPFRNSAVSAFAQSPKAAKIFLIEIWPVHFGLIAAMLAVIIIALCIVLIGLRGGKDNRIKARKWIWALPALAITEIFTHLVKAKTGNFHDYMPGFYSAPVLVVTSLVLLYLLRDRPKKAEKGIQPTPSTEVAKKAANA